MVFADELGTISKAVFLQKGDSNEVTKFNPENFVLGEKQSENSQSEKAADNLKINGKATSFATPVFPAAARAVRAFGEVKVKVLIDEDGDVITAEAQSGHPLLRAAAEKAAKRSAFSPTILEKQPVKVVGIIVYNFTP